MSSVNSSLADLTEQVENSGPDRSIEDFTYIDLGSVDARSKEVTATKRLLLADAPGRARQRVRSGDVLVSTVRPNLNGVAAVTPALDGAIASTGFCVLRPKPGVLDERYLLNWVRSPPFVAEMTRLATGASLPAVSDAIVKSSEIPLPHLPEQRRIAGILDEADELRAKRRRALALLEELADSIFIHVLGDPGTSAGRWPKLRVDEIAATRLGKMPDSGRVAGENRKPYLRNANVHWMRCELQSLAEMDFTEAEQSEFAVQPGDVMVCEGGQPGRCAIWQGQIEEVYFHKGLHRVTLDPAVMVPEVFVHTMKFLVEGGHLADSFSSASVAHLTSEKLRAIELAVPPIHLQAEYVASSRAVEALTGQNAAHLDRLDELFASLQHLAFRGEL